MIDSEYFRKIAKDLEAHHSIFDRLWSTFRPRFDDAVNTAGVAFDKDGACIDFAINEKFWNSISHEIRLFVISHECLHIVLYHGVRSLNLKKNLKIIANIAMDVVVNNMLVTKFGFIREEVDPQKKYYWPDTIGFTGEDVYFEKVLNFLLAKSEEIKKAIIEAGVLADNHEGIGSFTEDDVNDLVTDNVPECDIGDIAEEVKRECAGTESMGSLYVSRVGYVVKKKKWETVIERWVRNAISEREEEQWARVNRRYTTLPTEFLLPSHQDVEYDEKDKIEVWFFQDTSGSCSSFMDRFFKAAKSIPPDKFIIRMFCFDTRVYPTTLESGKLYGMGGTYFHPIEQYIQSELSKINRKITPNTYPSVWVITDGFGSDVVPQFPNNWHVFLCKGGSKANFKAPVNFHELENFE